MINVWIGLIFGITAKTVSPTRPRDVDAIPDSFTTSPTSRCFTTEGQRELGSGRVVNELQTLQKDTVCGSDQGPRIWCPVSVIQSTCKRKQARKELRELAHQYEWSQRG